MRRLIIHCSATSPKVDVGVKEIRKWHQRRGWRDVGYHYIIRRNGEVEQGRPENRTGAHARGYNRGSLGICLVGGVDKYNDPEKNYTRKQWDSLLALVWGLHEQYPKAEILGHRDLPGVAKACPCFSVKDWWAKYDPS